MARRWFSAIAIAALGALSAAASNCTSTTLADTDLCPGFAGFRTAAVPAGTGAAAAWCAALCCAQSDFCAAWVVRPVTVDAGACRANSTCCWTKPACADAVPSPGVTAGTVARPRPAGSPGFIDSEGWIGTAYTPARAANTLWWARFPEYEADVARELRAARRALAIPSLRVFLHTLAFEAVGAAAHARYVERFLAIAAANGIKVGFVLFGDGWNHGPDLPHAGNTGANASCAADGSECCPRQPDGTVGVKGCSNGCWFANPQDFQRGVVGADFDAPGTTNATYIEAAFRPFVDAVVAPHAKDKRVLFWEAYNEPCEWRHYEARICTRFQVLSSTLIKEGAYAWVKALNVSQPVQSCWSEANNTFSDLLAVHQYNSDFAAWNAQVFSECEPGATNATAQCARGAVVTEAGARWFEGFGADAGSPLTVLHWLSALRGGGGGPFVPGAFLAWELMVGNSNTRWASGPPCVASQLAREPPVPWCGLLWPDGTPVSHTEAARLRQYNGQHNTFLFFTDFLPSAADLTGDASLNLTSAGGLRFGFSAPVAGGAMVELAFWPSAAGTNFTAALSCPSSSPGAEGEEAWLLSVGTAAIVLLRRASGSGAPAVEVGRISAGDLECGIAIGAWNLLRVVLTPEGQVGGGAARERIEVYFNPLAHAAAPDLGRVAPRLNVSAPSSRAIAPSQDAVTRAVALLPVDGVVLVDYVSALPADGGLGPA